MSRYVSLLSLLVSSQHGVTHFSLEAEVSTSLQALDNQRPQKRSNHRQAIELEIVYRGCVSDVSQIDNPILHSHFSEGKTMRSSLRTHWNILELGYFGLFSALDPSEHQEIDLPSCPRLSTVTPKLRKAPRWMASWHQVAPHHRGRTSTGCSWVISVISSFSTAMLMYQSSNLGLDFK